MISQPKTMAFSGIRLGGHYDDRTLTILNLSPKTNVCLLCRRVMMIVGCLPKDRAVLRVHGAQDHEDVTE